MHKRLFLILISFLLYKKIPPPPHPKFVYNEMLFISVLILNIFYSMQHSSFTINRYGHLLSPFLFLYVSTLFYPCTSPLFTADRHISFFIENLQFMLGCTLARSHFEWYSLLGELFWRIRLRHAGTFPLCLTRGFSSVADFSQCSRILCILELYQCTRDTIPYLFNRNSDQEKCTDVYLHAPYIPLALL